MSDTTDDLLTKDPSLKRYFKYMLVNRKMSVQFTSKKIREIVESDLDIQLDPNTLYSKMCIDAFAYYMQSWPEWHIAVKSVYTDEWYESLCNYLKMKLLNLKKREIKHLGVGEKTEHHLALPENLAQNMDTQSKIIFVKHVNENSEKFQFSFTCSSSEQ